MGWKDHLGGCNPEAEKDSIAWLFNENLDKFEKQGQDGVALRANAAVHTFFERFGRPGDAFSENLAVIEVLPFAFLDNAECMAALAEYAVFRVSPQSADQPSLREALRKGLSMLARAGPNFDSKRLVLWKALNDDQRIFLWVALVDDATINRLLDSITASAERLRPQLEKQWRAAGIDPSQWRA